MITCKRSKFTISPRVTYLNCAYMAPLLKSVEKAGIRGLRRKRNPAEISAEDFFTDSALLRREFAKLIDTADPSRIAIIPSVSYGMATIARNLSLHAGEEMIVVAEQFPSNYYSWENLCRESGATLRVIQPPETTLSRGKIWNERILDAIGAKTRAVAIGNVHWADGTRFLLDRIRQRTREVGALLIVDGSQSVGALPLSVNEIEPDALVCAGYKWLMGPYALALAYYGPHFDDGKPIEESWINRQDSQNFSQLVIYNTNYQQGAGRYEVGEHSNFILIPMLLKAIQQLNRWGVGNIQQYCSAISKNAILTLQETGFPIEEEDYRAGHLFGVRFRGDNSQKIKEGLEKSRINVSYRGDAIRVSPNVYNREEDLSRLVKVLLK